MNTRELVRIMGIEKHAKMFLQKIFIIFISIFCIVSILFNASGNLIETAYEFQKSITKGDSKFSWQLLSLNARKTIEKDSMASMYDAIEVFERSELKRPTVDRIGFFNAKLTNSDGIIYFQRGVGGWRVEYIGPNESQKISNLKSDEF